MIQMNCQKCNAEYFIKFHQLPTTKYCSRSCVASSNVAGWNKQDLHKICKCCGIKYKTTKREFNRSVYCSRACQNRCQACTQHFKFRPCSEGNYRRKARENLAWICTRCQSGKNLLVHHKDEDRTNNDLSNLEVLCRRCHQMEHECWKNLPNKVISS